MMDPRQEVTPIQPCCGQVLYPHYPQQRAAACLTPYRMALPCWTCLVEALPSAVPYRVWYQTVPGDDTGC